MISALRLSTALALSGTGVAEICYEKFNFLPKTAAPTLGNSYEFVSEDNALLKVVTSGYYLNGTAAEIYRKGNTAFNSEDGIGMTVDKGNGKEIDRYHFVQIDFGLLKALVPATKTPLLQIGSAQSSEDAVLYGSKTAGILGELIKTYKGNDEDIIEFFEIPRYDEFQYFSITAAGDRGDGANILLNAIAVDCDRVVGDAICVNDVAISTKIDRDGSLGLEKAFTSGGQTITARGYTVEGEQSEMWGKVDSKPCETGIGMATDTRGNHEIDDAHFVQLDFSGLTVAPSSIELTIGSVQNGEGYKIYSSDTKGKLGTEIKSFDAVSDCVQYVSLAYGSKYYSVIATKGNVLIVSVLLGCNAPDLPVCTADATVATTCVAGPLGVTTAFTSADGTVTARGFELPEKGDLKTVVASSSDLYCKVTGNDVCETGIGMLTDTRGNNEIDPIHFVQLDFTALNVIPKNIELTIGSVQNGEGYKIYSSNILGVLGTLEKTFDAPSICTQVVTLPYGPKYYSVIAINGNVLVNSVLLSCETPDVITSSTPSATPTSTPSATPISTPSATPTHGPTYTPSATPTYAPTTCGNDVTVATSCAADKELTASQKFMSADGKQTITARGYDFPAGSDSKVLSVESNLHCKVDTVPCETGIGMSNDSTGNHEIDSIHFVQLDFSAVTILPAAIQLTIGSVQNGEGFKIYTSTTQGVLGGLIKTFNAASDCEQTVSIAYAKYVSVIATSGNVLVNAVVLSCKDISVAADAAAAPSYTSLGCFADGNPRALELQLHTKTIYYTVNDCYTEAAAQGFTVFGLQWGGECWVSHDLTAAKKYGTGSVITDNKVVSTKCDMECRSDTTANCGGPMANQLYSIGAAADVNGKCPGSPFPVEDRQLCKSGEWCSGCQYCRDGALCCNC